MQEQEENVMESFDTLPISFGFLPEQKYIIVQVILGDKKKFVLVTGPLEQNHYHSTLRDKFRSRLHIAESMKQAAVVATGGGLIRLDHVNKMVHAFGRSEDFGEEKERDTQTKEMLQDLFVGYVITTEPAPKK